jgi:tetrapyrrole methylase family protein / MazG family protein
MRYLHDHLTTNAAMPHDFPPTFDSLLAIMTRLRRECPWDREQTHDSIKGHTIEEAYEVVESIDHRDYDALRAELGDLLLHVVFHAEIAAGDGRFTIDDVLAGIIDKLVRRHPHIFGDTEVADSNDVRRNWEQIKMDEGRESVIDGIPDVLPALLKAHRMQDKASKVGFDWPHRDQVWAKVEEEIGELRSTLDDTDAERREDEFGDLLFALVNFARFIDVNPEDALRRTINKFARRFRHVEARFRAEERDMAAASLDEMDVFWDEAKRLGL